jgi:hypothetical protein
MSLKVKAQPLGQTLYQVRASCGPSIYELSYANSVVPLAYLRERKSYMV